jgi:hypothetical protein
MPMTVTAAILPDEVPVQAPEFASGKLLHLIGLDSLVQLAKSPEAMARLLGFE